MTPTAARVAKRTIDIVVGSVLVVLLAPVLVVAAIGSALVLRSSPVFLQTRVGRDQRRFTVIKIRTLPADAPRNATKYQLRATTIPRFTQTLRDLHIDELPQLLQVVAGSMSLVGPRPEMIDLHEAMAPSDAAERTTVRPGCTGLWQLSPQARQLIHEAPEYDRYYVAHRTLRLDAWILVQTALAAFRGRHPVTLSTIPEWTTRPLTGTRRHTGAPQTLVD